MQVRTATVRGLLDPQHGIRLDMLRSLTLDSIDDTAMRSVSLCPAEFASRSHQQMLTFAVAANLQALRQA